jgi:hypothetical protein
MSNPYSKLKQMPIDASRVENQYTKDSEKLRLLTKYADDAIERTVTTSAMTMLAILFLKTLSRTKISTVAIRTEIK